MSDLSRLRIGFALTGSHCTFEEIFPVVERLVKQKVDVLPIASEEVVKTDTRFGEANTHLSVLKEICGKDVMKSIKEVEPIGPQNLLDILLIAPCTGNTMSKLANGITDTAVTMAAKAHLRNRRPVVVGISTNDALGLNAKNLGLLLPAQHIYFVPFRQDDPINKATSCVAEWDLVEKTLAAAMDGRQTQPLLLGPTE